MQMREGVGRVEIEKLRKAFAVGQAVKVHHLNETAIEIQPYDTLEEQTAYILGYDLIKPDEVPLKVQCNQHDDQVQFLCVNKNTGQGIVAYMEPAAFLQIVEYLELCRAMMLDIR